MTTDTRPAEEFVIKQVVTKSDHQFLRYGYVGLFATILLFWFINKLFTHLFEPPESVRSQKQYWKWKNLFISWIHALIVGIWDLLSFVIYPEIQEDPIAYINWCTYAMITFSTGYFLYDFLDILLQGRASKEWEVVCHHLAVAGMFLWNVLTCYCIGYNCLALMAEVNSLFLHSRKLLQIHQFSFHHWFYRFICYINLITFLLCRFVPIGYIYHGMFTEYHRVSVAYMVILSAAMFVMSGINVVLFHRLLCSDIVRSFKGSGSRRKVSDNCDKLDDKENISNHLTNNNLNSSHIKVKLKNL